ncbi:hydrogenase expression/formation protein HupK [Tropicimonas sp. IMCC34043]|uniref:hydrogenase expression/formation protein HupK n=1 Tax=Tropicimonas sp. IMCC34043 TaxID=2248760 RepID=UPI000E288C5D|nr:hydrogenase expression/formation protein HupK [Tropicimonas sp. IMCC34043]
MLNRATEPQRLEPVIAPALPIAGIVVGRPVAEVVALVPRLFNLCRAAQEMALHLALDLPLPNPRQALTAEILREHVFKLCLVWPRALGLPGAGLPPDWQAGGRALAERLFGPACALPQTADGIARFLGSGHGVAPMLRRIADRFGPGEAACPALPGPSARSVFADPVIENSTAARHVKAPAMRAIEARHGRGPLWRAWGRAMDLETILAGHLPAPQRIGPVALVPAARGLYAVEAASEGGRITRFARMTPTDHLVRPGGVLRGCLASLPADRQGLAPLLLEILDPCTPIALREVAHA